MSSQIKGKPRTSLNPLSSNTFQNRIMNDLPEYENLNNVTFGKINLKENSLIEPLSDKAVETDITFAALQQDQNQNNVTFGMINLKENSLIEPLADKDAEIDITFAASDQFQHQHNITFGQKMKKKAPVMQKYQQLQKTRKNKQGFTCDKMLQVQRKLYKKVAYQVGRSALDSKIAEGIKNMKGIYK